MKLEKNILSKVVQAQKKVSCSFSYVWTLPSNLSTFVLNLEYLHVKKTRKGSDTMKIIVREGSSINASKIKREWTA